MGFFSITVSFLFPSLQSDRTLYTLDRGSEMKFEISPRVYLDSIPTKLIHFKSVKNQVGTIFSFFF